MTTKNSSKYIAVFTAVIYLTTQVWTPAHAQEKLAYAAAVPSVNTPQPLDFWRARSLNLPKQNSVVRSLKLDAKPENRTSHSGLNTILRKIAPHASISHLSVLDSNRPVVFLVQDIHLNTEAQLNIGKTLNEIHQSMPVVIGVEAAYGKFNFARYRLFPDAQVTRDIADHLLHEKLISAPSWMGLTAEGAVKMTGVDDPDLYTANVNAFKQAAGLQQGADEKISTELRAMDARKAQVLSPALLKVYESQKAYNAGTKPIFDHIKTLAALQPADRYPEIGKLLTAISLEKGLDQRKAQSEKEQLISRLSQKSSKDLQSLMALSLSYQAGELSPAGFFMELEKRIRSAGIELSAYPNLETYLRYVRSADSLDHAKVFEEISAYTAGVARHLARTPAEAQFMERARQLNLEKKLVAFELTPEEWSEYKKVVPSALYLVPGTKLGTRHKEPGTSLEAFESFYELAEARNEKMIRNLRQASQGSAVLVAGGFHSKGLTSLIKQKGYSLVVLSPKFSLNGAAGSDYLNEFLKERTPLARLFEGHKLTVGNAAQMLGGRENAGMPGSSASPALSRAAVLFAGFALIKGLPLQFVSYLVWAASNGRAVVTRISGKAAQIRTSLGQITIRLTNSVLGPNTLQVGNHKFEYQVGGQTASWITVAATAFISLRAAVMGGIVLFAGIISSGLRMSADTGATVPNPSTANTSAERRIAFIAAENSFFKTGGIGMVADALPKALQQAGDKVDTFLPYYKGVGIENYFANQGLVEKYVGPEFDVPMNGSKVKARWKMVQRADGPTVYLLECDEYFGTHTMGKSFNQIDGKRDPNSKPNPYNSGTDAMDQRLGTNVTDGESFALERYIFFSKGMLFGLPQLVDQKIIEKPTVLHLNDWHTTLIAPWVTYLSATSLARFQQHKQDNPYMSGLDDETFVKIKEFYRDIATAATWHNISFQGLPGDYSIYNFADSTKAKSFEHFRKLGLPRNPFWHPGGPWSLDFYGHLNFFLGVQSAHYNDTVSPDSARAYRVRQEDGGYGLMEGMVPVLAEQNRFGPGIQNKISESMHPSKFKYAKPYDASNAEKVRLENTEALLRYKRTAESKPLLEEGKSFDPDSFVIGLIGRAEDDKGWGLMPGVLEPLLNEARRQKKKIYFIGLGSGDVKIENQLKELQRHFPDNVRMTFDFDPKLAEMIRGGAHVVLAPSLFEPSGLTHLEGQIAGALPVVFPVGGFVDVIDGERNPAKGTGFKVEYVEVLNELGHRELRPVDFKYLHQARISNRDISDEERQSHVTALQDAMRRAILGAHYTFTDRRAVWKKMVQNAMNLDFYWSSTIHEYHQFYENAEKVRAQMVARFEKAEAEGKYGLSQAPRPFTLVLDRVYAVAAYFFKGFRGGDGYVRYTTKWYGAPLFEGAAILTVSAVVFFLSGLIPGVAGYVAARVGASIVVSAGIFYAAHFANNEFLSEDLPVLLSKFFPQPALVAIPANGTRGSPYNALIERRRQEILNDNVFWRAQGIRRMFTLSLLAIPLSIVLDLAGMDKNASAAISLFIAALLTIRPHNLFNIESNAEGKALLAGVPKPTLDVSAPAPRRIVPKSGNLPGLTIRTPLYVGIFIFAITDIVFLVMSYIFTEASAVPPTQILIVSGFASIPLVFLTILFLALLALPYINRPKGRDGYRLIWPLRALGATKISWLKNDYPILTQRRGSFDPSEQHSFYRMIPYAKTVWLSDLHSSLPPDRRPDKPVLVVNEQIMGPWMQLIILPVALFHKFLLFPMLNTTSYVGRLRNIIRTGINYFWYAPATFVGIFTFLGFVGVEIIWRREVRRQLKAGKAILEPWLHAYLADYRDADSGAVYTDDDIALLNSDPDVVNPVTHAIQKLSELIKGRAGPEALRIITDAIPPIKLNPLMSFDSYRQWSIIHADPKQEKIGFIPQPQAELAPLTAEYAPTNLTNASSEDKERGDEIATEAMQNGWWSKVEIAAGAGRRFVGHSARVPEFITKGILPIFDFVGGHGVKNALTLIHNSLSRRIPDNGHVNVAIVDQDINTSFVRRAVLRDPNRNYDPTKVRLGFHHLNGVPALHPRGGVMWIPADKMHLQGPSHLTTSPPGALAAVFQLMMDGTLLKWAREGVRYTKMVNGEDAGGVPDGTEMEALQNSGRAITFSLVDRKVTYTLEGPGLDQKLVVTVAGGKTEISVKSADGSKVPDNITLAKVGGNVQMDYGAGRWDTGALKWNGAPADELNKFGVPRILKDGQPLDLIVTKLGFETGGTPVMDAKTNRPLIKDDRDITYLPQFEQDRLRLSTPYYNTNQANIHLARLLKAFGFWEGDENTPPVIATHKAFNHMTAEDRRDVIVKMMESIPPVADSGKLAEGSPVKFHRMIWKLSDILQMVDGGFIVIDREGVKTRSGYMGLKGDGDPHNEKEILKPMSNPLHNLAREAAQKYRTIPKHFTTVTAAMMIFIAGSLAIGQDYWHPNLWGLPRQKIGEKTIYTMKGKLDGAAWNSVITITDGNVIDAKNLPAGIQIVAKDGKLVELKVESRDLSYEKVAEDVKDIEEPNEPDAVAKMTVSGREIIHEVENNKGIRHIYAEFFDDRGRVREQFRSMAVRRYIELMIYDIYKNGWQIVVQDKGTPYKGLHVESDPSRVTFHLAPAFAESTNVTIKNFDDVNRMLAGNYGTTMERLPDLAGDFDPTAVREAQDLFRLHPRGITQDNLGLQSRYFDTDGEVKVNRAITAVSMIPENSELGQALVGAQDQMKLAISRNEVLSKAIVWYPKDKLHFTYAGLQVDNDRNEFSQEDETNAVQVATDHLSSMAPHRFHVTPGVEVFGPAYRLIVRLKDGESHHMVQTARGQIRYDNRLRRKVQPRVPDDYYIALGRIAGEINPENIQALGKILRETLALQFPDLIVTEIQVINHPDATFRGGQELASFNLETGEKFYRVDPGVQRPSDSQSVVRIDPAVQRPSEQPSTAAEQAPQLPTSETRTVAGQPRRFDPTESLGPQTQTPPVGARITASVSTSQEAATGSVTRMEEDSLNRLQSNLAAKIADRGITGDDVEKHTRADRYGNLSAVYPLSENEVILKKVLGFRDRLKAKFPPELQSAIQWSADSELVYYLGRLEGNHKSTEVDPDRVAKASVIGQEILKELTAQSFRLQGVDFDTNILTIGINMFHLDSLEEGSLNAVKADVKRAASREYGQTEPKLNDIEFPSVNFIPLGSVSAVLSPAGLQVLARILSEFRGEVIGEMTVDQIQLNHYSNRALQGARSVAVMSLKKSQDLSTPATQKALQNLQGAYRKDISDRMTWGSHSRDDFEKNIVAIGVLSLASQGVELTPLSVWTFIQAHGIQLPLSRFLEEYERVIRQASLKVTGSGKIANDFFDRDINKLYSTIIGSMERQGFTLGQMANYLSSAEVLRNIYQQLEKGSVQYVFKSLENISEERFVEILRRDRSEAEKLAQSDWRFAILLNRIIQEAGIKDTPLFRVVINGIDVSPEKPATSLPQDMILMGMVGVLIAAALFMFQAPALVTLAFAYGALTALISGLAALVVGGAASPVAITDGKTPFGQLNPRFSILPLSLQAPHRSEEFSHFVMKTIGIPVWKNEVLSHSLTYVWMVLGGFIVAGIGSMAGNHQGTLAFILMAVISYPIELMVRWRATASTLPAPTPEGTERLNAILARGLLQTSNQNIISPDQWTSLLSKNGFYSPAITIYRLEDWRALSPTLLGSTLGAPRVSDADVASSVDGRAVLAKAAGPIVARALGIIGEKLSKASDADEAENILDQAAEALGHKLALGGISSADAAVILTALAAGAGLSVDADTVSDYQDQVEDAAGQRSSRVVSKWADTLPVGDDATLYYSWADIVEASQATDSASKKAFAIEIERIARHIAAARQSGDRRLAVVFSVSDDQDLKTVYAQLKEMAQNAAPAVAQEIKSDDIELHQNHKADPYGAYYRITQKGYTLNQLAAIPMNLENWDLGNFELFKRLGQDVVNNIAIRYLNLATGQFMGVEAGVGAALDSLNDA